MHRVNIVKYATSSPADVSPLARLQAEAGYRADQVLAVAGKTEGNGCVNDFSRTLAAAVWEPLLPADAVTVFSGGTEGVLSPHVTFVVREEAEDANAKGKAGGSRLAAAVGHTRCLEPHEIGTLEHARVVQSAVSALLTRADGRRISPDRVHLVLIKCPLLTTAKIAAVRQQGRTPLTTDTYESMAKSRYACAVGIAAALCEIEMPALSTTDGLAATEPPAGIWSAKASCSSGAELEDNHILVLAEDDNGGDDGAAAAQKSGLYAVSGYMKDAIDAEALFACQKQMHAPGHNKAQVVQVFVKAEADPGGLVRGQRHTMSTDSDIHSTRHARAAVGGLVAGVFGDPCVYVSGGAEGQGPPGGGSLCVIYRV